MTSITPATFSGYAKQAASRLNTMPLSFRQANLFVAQPLQTYIPEATRLSSP